MSIEVRPLTVELAPAFRSAISSTFGYDADLEDPGAAAHFEALFELDRMFPVFDGNEVVATGGDFGFQMAVPGEQQLSTSGLTIVTVRPTHTRQGALTMMMREHFARARERGEPLSALWASEFPIYGRFGYGPSGSLKEIRIDARQAGRGGREEGVTVRLVDVDEAKKLLPGIYAAIQPTRPGMYIRSGAWWEHRHFRDPEKHRGGASALRFAVAEAKGEPVGYVFYRQKASWDQLTEGEIHIREMMPVTDAAYRALWHFIVGIDLFPIVKYWNNPVDDPLEFLFHDGRAIRTKASDALWTRLVDVPAALRARRYSGDGAVTIHVADSFCDWNDGSYRIEVDDGAATCERVTSAPEVVMPASTLGALYMGGRNARALARVGLLEGDAGAIGKLDTLFRSYPAPWCPEIF
jgi:predicted acetyltransferase